MYICVFFFLEKKEKNHSTINVPRFCRYLLEISLKYKLLVFTTNELVYFYVQSIKFGNQENHYNLLFLISGVLLRFLKMVFSYSIVLLFYRIIL